MVSLCTVPARGGRLCERLGRYKNINRIPLPFIHIGGAKVALNSGLKILGCREPRTPLNSPATPSNFCREPKDVVVFIYTTSLGSFRGCNWAPWIKS